MVRACKSKHSCPLTVSRFIYTSITLYETTAQRYGIVEELCFSFEQLGKVQMKRDELNKRSLSGKQYARSRG